MALNNPIDNSI